MLKSHSGQNVKLNRRVLSYSRDQYHRSSKVEGPGNGIGKKRGRATQGQNQQVLVMDVRAQQGERAVGCLLGGWCEQLDR